MSYVLVGVISGIIGGMVGFLGALVVCSHRR